MKQPTFLAFKAIGMLAISVARAAFAVDGDIDPGFGNQGVARTGALDVNAYANVAVQPDGKIVTCGTRTMNGLSGHDFLIARFNGDGTPDTSFSFDGKTTIDFDGGTGQDQCYGIAVQPDGKIVAVGFTRGGDPNSDRFALARMNNDGTLDTSFGAGSGKTTVAFAGRSGANTVVLQGNGRIVAAGHMHTSASNVDFAVARLLPDGTRDASFNLSGTVVIPFDLPGHGTDDEATCIAIDREGRIVVGGTAGIGVNGAEFAAARLLANGALDADFDADGRIAIDFGLAPAGSDVAGMTIQRDGRVLLAGLVDTAPTGPSNYDMAVVRLQPDGTLDGAFGVGGKTLVPFDLTTNGQDSASGILEQGNGRLMMVGYALTSTSFRGAAARLKRDGSLDEQFGAFGKQTYDFGLTTPSAQVFDAIAWQGNQIIAAGFAAVPGSASAMDVIVTRLENDLLFADGWE